MRAVPTTLPAFAVITAVPAVRAVTKPASLTDAIASFEDDQRNGKSGMRAPLSAYAIAESWRCSPTASLVSAGLTTTACTNGPSGADRLDVARDVWQVAGMQPGIGSPS